MATDGTRRVSARLAEYVDDALERYAPGEEIVWEAGLTALPSGGLAVVLVLWVPSPVLGEMVLAYNIVSNPVHGPQDRDLVDTTVHTLIEQLRRTCSEALQRGLDRLPVAGAVNGSVPSAPRPFLRP